jgi:hypothetical protein
MKNQSKHSGLGIVIMWATGLAGACSVDTSDLHFVPDDDFGKLSELGDAGDGNIDTGGVGNIAGVLNKAGSGNKAGSNSGGVPGTGGTSSTGGTPPTTGGTSSVGGGVSSGGVSAAGMQAVGSLNDPLLDDFNDMNPMLPNTMMNGSRMGGWYITNDGTGNMMPPADPTKPPIPDFKPDYNNMGYAMHLKGGGFKDWGANLGVTLVNAQGRPPCPYDLSRFSGIRFYLQGMVSDGVLHFSLTTAETADAEHGGTCDIKTEKCFDNFAFDLMQVSPNWKLIQIPWSALKQGGWGAVKQLNVKNVLNIEFGVKPNTTFDFMLDQVEFY